MKDLYTDFAKDYDEFGDISDYLGDEAGFFKALFHEHNVNSVLDCACGTGQHLLMCRKLGREVVGSDYSEAMLRQAEKNLQKHDVSVPLKQCDFRSLEQAWEERYDAVLCLTTALPHLHKDADLVTALRSMRDRITDGGILVLTSGTTEATLAMEPIEVVVNREDFSRIFVKEQDDRFLTIHVLDLFHSTERLENNKYDICYRILLEADYRELLKQAGFSNVSVYGDYQRTPYQANQSMRCIVVAEK